MNHTLFRALARLKYVIAIAVFVVTTGFLGENCVVERMKHKQEIEALEQDIAAKRKKFDEDHKRLEEIKNSPEAVRRLAREKYYMKEADEDVFIIHQ